jgi:hypothetical protein
LGKKNGVRSAHEQYRQTGRAMKSLLRAGDRDSITGLKTLGENQLASREIQPGSAPGAQ